VSYILFLIFYSWLFRKFGRVLFRNNMEFVYSIKSDFHFWRQFYRHKQLFFKHLISDFSLLQESRIILSCKCQNCGKMCYCKYMSTHQAWIDRTRRKHRFHVSSFPSFSFPSFFPSFLPSTSSPTRSNNPPTPLPATTLRSTASKCLQRQNGDHPTVRNYPQLKKIQKHQVNSA